MNDHLGRSRTWWVKYIWGKANLTLIEVDGVPGVITIPLEFLPKGTTVGTVLNVTNAGHRAPNPAPR